MPLASVRRSEIEGSRELPPSCAAALRSPIARGLQAGPRGRWKHEARRRRRRIGQLTQQRCRMRTSTRSRVESAPAFAHSDAPVPCGRGDCFRRRGEFYADDPIGDIWITPVAAAGRALRHGCERLRRPKRMIALTFSGACARRLPATDGTRQPARRVPTSAAGGRDARFLKMRASGYRQHSATPGFRVRPNPSAGGGRAQVASP